MMILGQWVVMLGRREVKYKLVGGSKRIDKILYCIMYDIIQLLQRSLCNLVLSWLWLVRLSSNSRFSAEN